jgi:hypothetical protein
MTPEEFIVHGLLRVWADLTYQVPVWALLVCVYLAYSFGKSRGVKQILHRQGIAKSKGQ